MSPEEPNAKKARIATDSVENKMEDVSAMVAGILSEDPSLQLESTIKFRKILSLDAEMTTPSTENLIQYGVVVARFIEFLDKKDSPKLQHEAAWAIADIASDKPELVIGAVPNLVKLLASPNDDVLEQAIWALCNVASSSIQSRDKVLNCGALIPLCSKLNEETTKLSMLKIGTWTLLNLCRGKPSPLFDNVKGALPTLKGLLHSDDEQVLKDACSTLFYMSYGSQAGTQSVIEAGFIPILVQLLQHTSPSVLLPLFSVVWFLTSKDNQQIQLVIDGGALPILANLLTQDNEKTIKEACLMIININVGTVEQIQSTIDAKLIPILVNLAQNAELDIKMKAVWAIISATKGGSDDQIKYLVEQNCIKPLCDNLVYEDLRVIIACLDGLANILKVGEAEKNTGDHYRQLIIDAEGQAKIKNLQSDDRNEIKEKAVKILETFWPEEEDEKTQLQPPK